MRLRTRLRSIFKDVRWEFTGERHYKNSNLRRIRRLSDGRIGGWVEGEHNLPQDQEGWVEANATVREHAVVRGRAVVDGDATIYGHALIEGDARVSGTARISDRVCIDGFARVWGKSRLWNDVYVAGQTIIVDADVYSTGVINGASSIKNARVSGDVDLTSCAIYAKAEVRAGKFDGCEIRGDIRVTSATTIRDAVVAPENILRPGKWALKAATMSNGRTAVLYRSNTGDWMIAGLLYGEAIRLNKDTTIADMPSAGNCAEEHEDIVEMFRRHVARIEAQAPISGIAEVLS